MNTVSKWCIWINCGLFAFACVAGTLQLQILSLSNIALFLVYFIIQK